MSARRARRCGASAPAGETLRRETCPRLLSISGAHLTNRSSPGRHRAQGSCAGSVMPPILVVGGRLGWRSQGLGPMRESRRPGRSSSEAGGRRVGHASRSGGGDCEEVQAGAGVRGGTQARRSARVPLPGSSCTGTRARGDAWPLTGAGFPQPGSLHCGGLENPAKEKCVS